MRSLHARRPVLIETRVSLNEPALRMRIRQSSCVLTVSEDAPSVYSYYCSGTCGDRPGGYFISCDSSAQGSVSQAMSQKMLIVTHCSPQ